MAKVGRPSKYSEVDEMQKKIDEYFGGSHIPTVTGLALHLGFSSRRELLDYQGKPQYSHTITRAKSRCEEYAEQRLFDRDGQRGAEFSLRCNFRWSDSPEQQGGTDGGGSRYAGLPANAIGRAYIDVNRDIDSRRHRQYDFKGGRGSLKSSFCALKLIDLVMTNPKFCAIAVRQVKDTLRESVYNQIVWAIEELGLEDEFYCTVSPMAIRRVSTGQVIYFRGADNPMKIKSIRPPNDMYIGVCWFEEADQLDSEEDFRNILQSVIRGGEEAIILRSYNTPRSREHYINVEAMEPDAKTLVHHSYYYDAPREWLGEPFFEMAEELKRTNERAYRHEYLGEATGSGGNVFENIVHETITNEQIKNFDRVLNGVDWGFYPDPWAFVRCHFHSGSQTLYIFDEEKEYKKGNSETAGILKAKGVSPKEEIIADSAEPKSVKDYQDYGLPHTRGADKGIGSVDYSMKWLQSLSSVVIDKNRCPNTYQEFVSYEYDRNKNGEVISGYPDRNNHFIDATRYATNDIWKNRKGNTFYKF